MENLQMVQPAADESSPSLRPAAALRRHPCKVRWREGGTAGSLVEMGEQKSGVGGKEENDQYQLAGGGGGVADWEPSMLMNAFFS